MARAEAAMRRELEMARHERRERKEKEKREREEGCGIINCLARPLIVGEKLEPIKMILPIDHGFVLLTPLLWQSLCV